MIFNRIKLNYNIKLLDDGFQSQDYSEVQKILRSNKSNGIYSNLVSYAIHKHLSQEAHFNFYSSKFIWLSSYDQRDLSFIYNFLDFYFQNNQSASCSFGDYQDQISDALKEIKNIEIPQFIDFDHVVSNSFLYQLFLLLLSNKKYIFSNIRGAFFESPTKKFLIYPQTTLCYIHVHRNPYDLYFRYKKDFQNSQEALNEIANSNQFSQKKSLKYQIMENRQDWNTFTKSWTNNNVENTYRGKLIKYENLENSPKDTLIEVIYHLKQAGMNLDIDFDLIDKFIQINNVETISKEQISNQELKLVDNNFESDFLKKLGYSY
tara:strand:+ start:101 stop:1057 length:957 start_codon:yes stop_codon:yes gene_type:complete